MRQPQPQEGLSGACLWLCLGVSWKKGSSSACYTSWASLSSNCSGFWFRNLSDGQGKRLVVVTDLTQALANVFLQLRRELRRPVGIPVPI